MKYLFHEVVHECKDIAVLLFLTSFYIYICDTYMHSCKYANDTNRLQKVSKRWIKTNANIPSAIECMKYLYRVNN